MLRKSFNYVLIAILLISCFAIGGVTLGEYWREFGYALSKGYTNYIKEDGQPFAALAARISALNTTINRTLIGKDEFEQFNMRFQMSLGKQVFSVGADTMVKLKTGQLYDLMGDADVTADVKKMGKLRENLDKMGIAMLYVYPHSYIYQDDMLPEGVADFNASVADTLVQGFKGEGIDVIDSRDVVQAAALPLDEVIYRTDQHWSTQTVFETFRATAAKLNEMGFFIDPSLYAKENFSFETYPQMLMGQVGERLGPSLITPDDFVLIAPNYETSLSKKIVNGKDTEEVSGSFSDLLNRGLIDDAQREGVANLYSVYGNHDAENWYINDNVSSGRILIAKDSYATPLTAFLSLTVHETLAVDLRKSLRTIEDYAREFKPDLVIVAHSQNMFREANYVFIE
jgi:hypothetical protein